MLRAIDWKVFVLHILYGEDDFSCCEALKALVSTCTVGDLAESNTTTIDGRTATVEQIASACDSMPFFSTSRIVVVEGLFSRFAQRRARGGDPAAEKAGDGAFLSELESYVQRMPPSTALVLIDGEVKPANPLFKRLSPRATVKAFGRLKGGPLHDWIQDRVTQKGGKISASAARLVADFAGDNLWAVNNELDKLLIYSTGPSITDEDVRESMSRSREANQWAMMDALMARRTGVAQQLLHQLMDEGAKATNLIPFLGRELALVLRAREALDQAASRDAVSTAIGVAPGFRLDKIVKQARECTMSEIRTLYRLLVDADLAIKTGTLGEEMALDLFVADACRR